MEYTLENMQKLILAIAPDQFKAGGHTKAAIDKWLATAANESQVIQIQLRKDIFSIQHERTLEIFVASCQLSLIDFADTLNNYFQRYLCG